MRPVKYVVHYGAEKAEFTQRARARGFKLMMEAKGHKAWIEPIFRK